MQCISKTIDKKIELNESLDKILTEKTITQEKETKEKSFKENKSKIQKILDMQKLTIEKQKKTIKEGNDKGDLIYKHYNEIQDIIAELNKIRKKYSWKEIKTKLKSHKVIKEINEKTGKITLELEQ